MNCSTYPNSNQILKNFLEFQTIQIIQKIQEPIPNNNVPSREYNVIIRAEDF